ncbi:hypothetical protein [Streptomyces sp. NPDC088348]|uniref:hypothetical protein n=1 Tax=Streptomyces sp. NPDC088348 TaxID=3365853 RepID=UPI00380616A5
MGRAKRVELPDIATRRAALIRYRREGVPFEDPRIMDLGYSSRGAATKDWLRALQERRDEQSAEASTYRQEENERLDALLAAAWPRATKPSPVFNKEGDVIAEEIDLRAVETVLKLMDRRAKLMGLDMPVRTELSGPDGGAVQFGAGSLAELDALITAARDGGTPVPAEGADDDSGA